MFDTLAYTRKLKDGGFSEDQTIALLEATMISMEGGVATKADLAGLETKMVDGFGAIRSEMATLETKMVDGFGAVRSEMGALETRMNKEIMHMAWKTTAVLALLITILKFIH